MKPLRWMMYLSLGVVIILGVIVVWTAQAPQEVGAPGTEEGSDAAPDLQVNRHLPDHIHHIHGLGFADQSDRLVIASHYGLRFYEDGEWLPTIGVQRDYMGFQIVAGGFYSSGHPAETFDRWLDPIGIVFSDDLGENVEILDLHGETDFHGMAVSYSTHTIYVVNDRPNSRMSDRGLYYSTDRTVTWTAVAATGLQGVASSITAHPFEAETLVLGTSAGVYRSMNSGEQFERILPELQQVTAVRFDPNGVLWVATAEGTATEASFHLYRSNETLTAASAISIPPLAHYIAYIAPHHTSSAVVAFATAVAHEEQLYLSDNLGASWQHLVVNGQGQ